MKGKMILGISGWLLGTIIIGIVVGLIKKKRLQKDIAEKEIELEQWKELEKFHELCKKENARIREVTKELHEMNQKEDIDEVKLNKSLGKIMDVLGCKKPWTGDFDEFMKNKDNKLIFG